MNSDQLQYLIDISKTGSINTTAKRLYTSQPAVSESIKKLESELHCTILKRSKRGVTLTPDGRYILSHALPIMEHYDKMVHYKETAPTPHGVLSIGVAAAITNTLLGDLIMKMQESHPNVSLYTYESGQEEILDACKKGTIDFGLFGIIPVDEDPLSEYGDTLCLKPLFSSPMVCVMSKNNPLAQNSSILFNSNSSLRFTFYNYSEAFCISDISCLHISSNADIHKRFMCEKNTGCILPKYFADRLFRESKFTSLPMEDIDPALYYLAYRKDKKVEQNSIYKSFIQSVTELTKDL